MGTEAARRLVSAQVLVGLARELRLRLVERSPMAAGGSTEQVEGQAAKAIEGRGSKSAMVVWVQHGLEKRGSAAKQPCKRGGQAAMRK